MIKKGFALIYVLIFVVLLLIAVSAVWFTGMAEVKLSRRSTYSVQAYQLAQSAIERGWVEYKEKVGTSLDVNQLIPLLACNLDPNRGYAVKRITIDSNGNLTSSDAYTKDSVNSALYGVYDYRICNREIEGIGYYRGVKILLKADINVDNSPCVQWDPISGTCTAWDHSKNYYTIYQVGPD